MIGARERMIDEVIEVEEEGEETDIEAEQEVEAEDETTKGASKRGASLLRGLHRRSLHPMTTTVETRITEVDGRDSLERLWRSRPTTAMGVTPPRAEP